jgi:hypothetical protein
MDGSIGGGGFLNALGDERRGVLVGGGGNFRRRAIVPVFVYERRKIILSKYA